MPGSTAEVLICGAGIAGIFTAYHLAVKHGVKDIVLVDERPPLSLTSDKSTEAYRNWWPGLDDAMIRLMNRSIDILEELARESGNRLLLNRRGYIYATANPDHLADIEAIAELAASMGAGPIRYHKGRAGEPPYIPSPAEGFEDQPTGADLILDQTLIRDRFPYLSEQIVAVLHVRRCGWFSGQQLGMYLLERARQQGVRLIQARVKGVSVTGGRVRDVHLDRPGFSTTISSDVFVNAAGPMLRDVGAMLGVELPVFSELHLKVAFKDHLGVIPRDAPLLIWDDPQVLLWSEEAGAVLAESEETRFLLGTLPAGVHARPEGGSGSQNILILWPYHVEPVEAIFPLPEDPLLPEVAMLGMSSMIPGLRAYLGQLPRPYVDGGYYTKTQENRLLSCPLPIDGVYMIGALSGFGLMASAAAAELLAAHVTTSPLPPYAAAFSLERYHDPDYRARVEAWGSAGQL